MEAATPPRQMKLRRSHSRVEQECSYLSNFHQGSVYAVISLLLAVTGIVVSILVVTLHTDSIKRHVTRRMNEACQGTPQVARRDGATGATPGV